MIENVYPINNSKAIGMTGRSRKLPRNIRACGQGGGTFPVYIEDYVGTYIRRLAESGFPECSAVILVGQVMETETGRCLFVRGAVNASRICIGDRPVFGEDVWSEVYEKIRLYFPEDEVVGWCVAGPGFRLLQEDVFLRAHIDNFADSEKVFLCYESLEKELTLRICMTGGFCVLPGYYVYYEKNDEMQNYMLEEPVERKETKGAQEISKVSQPEERKKESKKDILQLAAIACIIVLIVSVMMGTDALSVLKESTFAEGTKDEEQTPYEENLSVEEPEEFAFGDFDFLEAEEPEGKKEQEKDREEQEAEPENVKKEEESTGEENANMSEEQMAEEFDGEPEHLAETDVIQKEDNTEEAENPDIIEEETVTVLSPSEYTSYIVKSGDTLAGICMEIYGSVELLHYVCELNQLKNIDSIYAGQELIFPK